MKIIRNGESARIGALGKQNIKDNTEYRPLIYTTYVDTEDGFLVYNNLTDELLLLSEQEKRCLDDFDISEEICKTMIEKWFYIPESFKDVKLSDQIDTFMAFLIGVKAQNTLTTYTIFPTTDCNARCFYCYEKDIPKFHMTDKVASDTADYITKQSKGHNVKIRWFGGEPLYNSRAIDIICEKLHKNGTKFVSSMISNGYLFNDEIIDSAIKLWNLKRVQITLDGTEEKYNKIKAFIYDDANPFERVIANIEKLLKADIFVAIRMNMDNHNYENLFELVQFLCEKFGEYKNITMYSQTLFDESTEKHMLRTADDKTELYKNNYELNSYILEKGLCEEKTLDGFLKNHQCMADNDAATTITPDGNLGKCEHFSDHDFWGSIYSDDINKDMIDKYSKRIPFDDRCDICPVRPGCVSLEVCPNAPACNEMLQKSRFLNVETRIKNTYKEYKKKQPQQ